MLRFATLCVVLSLLIGIGAPEAVRATAASTTLGHGAQEAQEAQEAGEAMGLQKGVQCDLFVSFDDGSDSAAGTSINAPLKTLQAAIDRGGGHGEEAAGASAMGSRTICLRSGVHKIASTVELRAASAHAGHGVTITTYPEDMTAGLGLSLSLALSLSLFLSLWLSGSLSLSLSLSLSRCSPHTHTSSVPTHFSIQI